MPTPPWLPAGEDRRVDRPSLVTSCRTFSNTAPVRKRRGPEPTDDPDLAELRRADSEYHRLCIDIQEPDVLATELPLEGLAESIRLLSDSVQRLTARRNEVNP